MKREFATPDEREIARDLYCLKSDDNIEVDDDAKVSRVYDEDTGELMHVWVQAWVYVSAGDLPHNYSCKEPQVFDACDLCGVAPENHQ